MQAFSLKKPGTLDVADGSDDSDEIIALYRAITNSWQPIQKREEEEVPYLCLCMDGSDSLYMTPSIKSL